jgi:hypothetical protein
MAGSIDVPIAAIARAWKRAGSDAIALLLKNSGPAERTGPVTTEAVRRVNATHEPGDGRLGAGARVTYSPKGPMIMGYCDSEAMLRSYLAELATGPAELGMTRGPGRAPVPGDTLR